jgi:hypothetical protein
MAPLTSRTRSPEAKVGAHSWVITCVRPSSVRKVIRYSLSLVMLDPVVPVLLLPPTAALEPVPAPVAAPPDWRCTTSILATVLLGALALAEPDPLLAAALPEWLWPLALPLVLPEPLLPEMPLAPLPELPLAPLPVADEPMLPLPDDPMLPVPEEPILPLLEDPKLPEPVPAEPELPLPLPVLPALPVLP